MGLIMNVLRSLYGAAVMLMLSILYSLHDANRDKR